MTRLSDATSSAFQAALARVSDDSGSSLRRLVTALDDALFATLLRAEMGVAGPAERTRLDNWVFYRRRALESAQETGVPLGEEAMRALFHGCGSDRLILLVTHACQLRCAYCRVRKYAATMGAATARAGVDWLMGGLRQDVELQFFGGEPLLAMPVVRAAVDRALEGARVRGKSVRFLLTTNGLALGKTEVAFLREHRFSVELSCDGTMSAQDSQRPTASGGGSWERLRDGMGRLRDAGVPYQVIAVIMPEDADLACERVERLAELGHTRIQVNYALGRHWAPDQASRLRASMRAASVVAARLGVELVNETRRRREPVVLNSELTVDCDGTVFRETGICLEEDFARMKNRFRVVRLEDAGLIDSYGATPFDNLALLASAYGEGEMRRVLLSNLELGRSFAATT